MPMLRFPPYLLKTIIFPILLLGAFLPGPSSDARAQIDLSQEAPPKLDLKPTDVIHWESVGATIDSKGVITINLRLRTEQNFTLYQDKVKFAGPAGYQVTAAQTPPTKSIIDPIEGHEVAVYAGGDFVVTATGLEPWGKSQFPLSITYLGCTERICLFPYTEQLDLALSKGEASSESEILRPAPQDDGATPQDGATQVSGRAKGDIEQTYAEKIKQNELSWGWLLVVLFLGGLATNLTPCVFPMIPITLRLLGRQGASPFLNSSLYAAGIIVTYSLLGLVAAATGGLFGSLLASTTFNVIFATLFVLFGLSMLGFGDLSVLQRVGSRIGSGGNGPGQTFLMGAGAGLVAAPCTGPILGSLLAVTTQMPLSKAFLLFFVYAVGFGFPYIFLGLSAARVTRIRLSHYWQLAVKLVFASAMFGLALYYLRIPAHQWLQGMHGQWRTTALLTLGVGVAATLAVLFRPGWDFKKTLHIIPTLLLGIGLFAGTQWLTGGDRQSAIVLHWHKTETEGLATAQTAQKPILIDGWAEWCEACKKMDATTFQDATIRQKLLDEWVLIKLDLTDLNDANEKLAEKYGLQGLPTLVLLPPDGDLTRLHKITGYVSAEHLLRELADYTARDFRPATSPNGG